MEDFGCSLGKVTTVKQQYSIQILIQGENYHIDISARRNFFFKFHA